MPSTLSTIKTKIKANLDALVTAGTLGEVQVDDFRKSVFNRNIGAFPAAILTTPTVESTAETNRQNMRAYTFEVIVLSKLEDVTDAAQVEDLIEAILNQFDNDPTLKGGGATGAADGGVEPSTSTPEAVSSEGASYVAFSVVLRARAIRELTFT